MSGAIAGAVVVAGAGAYAANQANKAADQRAADANAANSAAANRSRELSYANNQKRRAELLRRFNIKAGKTADTVDQINQGVSVKLTEFDRQMAGAQSLATNSLATKQITGRLAQRMLNVQSVQGNMKRGTILQEAEAAHKSVGDNLEMMRMNYESEDMNVGIDLSNAINAANNQEVRGWTASTSTGTAGVVVAGIQGAASGVNAGAAIGGAFGGGN